MKSLPAAGFLCVLLLSSLSIGAPIHEPLAAFCLGPRDPAYAPLLHRSDGTFYGTTPLGGSYNLGTIYRVSSAGAVAIAVSFSGTSGVTKGSSPYGGLVEDSLGRLWGTTSAGGSDDFGTIFRFDPATGVFTTIAEFTGAAGTHPGMFPTAGLVADGSGVFWGTTVNGGADGIGSVFKVNATTAQFTEVVGFTDLGAVPGSYPSSELVYDAAGFLWGTTQFGGEGQAGTIFKIDRATGTFTSVFSFPESSPTNSGAYPRAALVSDGAGFLWGTTPYAAPGRAGGTVFKINRATGAFAVVRLFDTAASAQHGQALEAGLCNDGSGKMWGLTSEGGTASVGTLFKIGIADGAFTTVHQFAAANSARHPRSSLVSDGAGSLWSSAAGGIGNAGVVFKLNTGTGSVASVAGFAVIDGMPKGDTPNSDLVSDGTGYLWGTTTNGGTWGRGTVYKVHEQTGAITTIAEFSNEPGAVKGAFPYAGLTSDGAGFLWGSTSAGGTNAGTIYKVNAATGVLTTVVEFNGTTIRGASPYATLVRDSAGILWGSTRDGGNSGFGTIFKLNPSTGALTTVVHFTGIGGVARGSRPHAPLVADGAGFFWGCTQTGSSGNLGTVFKCNASTGAVTTLIQFTGPGGASPGNAPLGALVSDGAGSFLGTTSAETTGTTYLGTVFKINATTGVMTTLAYFSGTVGPVFGRSPWAGLMKDSAGNIWGTSHGGSFAPSTIFKISPAGGFTHVLTFTGVDGNAPGRYPGYGRLLQRADGNFYGTTAEGGSAGGGTVFRLRFGPTPTTRSATIVRSRTARLNAIVNPNGSNTSVSFEWGLSPSGLIHTTNATALPGESTAAAVGMELADLLPATTYYFRVRAENGDQFTPQFGEVLSFITNAPPTGGSLTISPDSPVRPSAPMTAAAPGWTDPQAPLAYEFLLDGAPLGPPGPATSVDFMAPATLGEHVIAARIFDALGDSSDVTRTFVVNTPPVIRRVTLGSVSGTQSSIAVPKLLTYVSDADGDVVTLIAVSATSARGGTIAWADGIIRYSAPTAYSGEDTFTFTVRDTRGAIVTGTVAVQVAPATPTLNVISMKTTPDGFSLKFAGVPGGSYLIQFQNAIGEPWQTLTPPGLVIAGANGLFEFEDKPSPRPAARFYRAIQP